MLYQTIMMSQILLLKPSVEPGEFSFASVCSSSLCLSPLSIGTQSDVVIKVRLQWKLNC